MFYIIALHLFTAQTAQTFTAIQQITLPHHKIIWQKITFVNLFLIVIKINGVG